jgi:S1-C subfamily serine protease
MRLGPFAVQIGFLLTSYALGVASGRQEAAHPPPITERLPVAGSARETAPVPAVAAAASPASLDPQRGADAARASSLPAASPPSWSQIAARAQGWTVAVRADQSYGAGVAVERAGFVLTNLHVVDGAKVISVTPFGGEAISAELLDSDRDLDLALLRSSAPLPKAAVVGDSQALGVGDEVMAVGSPRKMYFSVSRGMVSFPNRFLDGVEYIQTDLPINVGNSGGPLVDRDGDVVGIVSFILRDSQGISFALPIDRAVARFGQHLTMNATLRRKAVGPATAAASTIPSVAASAAAPSTRGRPATASKISAP